MFTSSGSAPSSPSMSPLTQPSSPSSQPSSHASFPPLSLQQLSESERDPLRNNHPS